MASPSRECRGAPPAMVRFIRTLGSKKSAPRGARILKNASKEIAMNPIDKNASGSTTGAGAPAASDRNSLTVGADGPVVLHDVHFLEQKVRAGSATKPAEGMGEG